jgi:hypothetical protein
MLWSLNALSYLVAIGFNVETVTYKNINFQVWDLGGEPPICLLLDSIDLLLNRRPGG